MRNQLKTLLLFGVLSTILIGIGGSLGPSYLYAFTALALLLVLGAYFFSHRIVLAATDTYIACGSDVARRRNPRKSRRPAQS